MEREREKMRYQKLLQALWLLPIRLRNNTFCHLPLSAGAGRRPFLFPLFAFSPPLSGSPHHVRYRLVGRLLLVVKVVGVEGLTEEELTGFLVVVLGLGFGAKRPFPLFNW